MNLEQAINSVIRNGNKIAEGGLGTILPDNATLDRVERESDKREQKLRSITDSSMAQFERRSEGGEIRYYDGANRYAIMNRMGKILWFELRNGQWYSAKA